MKIVNVILFFISLILVLINIGVLVYIIYDYNKMYYLCWAISTILLFCWFMIIHKNNRIDYYEDLFEDCYHDYILIVYLLGLFRSIVLILLWLIEDHLRTFVIMIIFLSITINILLLFGRVHQNILLRILNIIFVCLLISFSIYYLLIKDIIIYLFVIFVGEYFFYLIDVGYLFSDDE